MSRDTVIVKCDGLGVEFCHHADSAMMRVAGWYHYLRGNPLFNHSVFVTVHPYIFVPDAVENPFDEWSVVDHELVHWVRQRDYGTAKWVASYLTSWQFREHEEKVAFLRDLKNNRMSVRQVVSRLRGPLYGVKTSRGDLESWFNSKLAVRVPERQSDGV